MGKHLLILFILLIVSDIFAQEKAKTKDIPYNHGETELQGTLVYDPLLKSIRSAVMVVPDIWGVDDQIRAKAEKLAALGHIVFIADLYGKGKKIASLDSAQDKANSLLENKALLLERITLGLDQLRAERKVDQGKLGIVGYGLGATAILDLAMMDPGIKAYALFYPQPALDNPDNYKGIKGSFLFFFGDQDPYLPHNGRGEFQDALNNAGTDWQMVIYGDAVRGFCNSNLGFEINEGMAYNYNADLRSFDAMRQFFSDLLK